MGAPHGRLVLVRRGHPGSRVVGPRGDRLGRLLLPARRPARVLTRPDRGHQRGRPGQRAPGQRRVLRPRRRVALPGQRPARRAPGPARRRTARGAAATPGPGRRALRRPDRRGPTRQAVPVGRPPGLPPLVARRPADVRAARRPGSAGRHRRVRLRDATRVARPRPARGGRERRCSGRRHLPVRAEPRRPCAGRTGTRPGSVGRRCAGRTRLVGPELEPAELGRWLGPVVEPGGRGGAGRSPVPCCPDVGPGGRVTPVVRAGACRAHPTVRAGAGRTGPPLRAAPT
ncbi:hypothetical protein GA0070616_1924 [Micromonospora nigra]|uniref:Uncharacterized protein n=1 Tax=Micromonospora nigra TaxID=145857 RepID=A0A1C6RSQ4_9ACTN|nr:hypothetical protein GA0070616_1924 [Micromonospora nigra]